MTKPLLDRFDVRADPDHEPGSRGRDEYQLFGSWPASRSEMFGEHLQDEVRTP
ncbi:MAG TPA: hypothetical protein VIB48_05000 [Acidimicrobiia bacterium]